MQVRSEPNELVRRYLAVDLGRVVLEGSCTCVCACLWVCVALRLLHFLAINTNAAHHAELSSIEQRACALCICARVCVRARVRSMITSTVVES